MKHGLLLAALGLLAPLAAQAVYVCTDAGGKTVYQDRPCENLASQAANSPQAATVLTPAVADEAVRRFRAALSARDVSSATRFLAPGFKATIRNAQGDAEFDEARFARMLTEVLNAATRYETTARCQPANIERFSATLACEVSERVVLLKRTAAGSASETYKVVLVGGYAKLAEIDSRPH